MKEAGVTEEDVKTVKLKSVVEEDAESTVAEESKLTDEEKLKKLMDESKTRLNDELDKFTSEEGTSSEAATTQAVPAPTQSPMAVNTLFN